MVQAEQQVQLFDRKNDAVVASTRDGNTITSLPPPWGRGDCVIHFNTINTTAFAIRRAWHPVVSFRHSEAAGEMTAKEGEREGRGGLMEKRRGAPTLRTTA